MSDKKKVCKWAGVIYVLTNLVNGKQYVGKTEKYDGDDTNLRRWNTHITCALNGKSQNYVHRAIRKYGVNNFSAEVVQRCRTYETLNRAETKWIKRLNTFAPAGYNMTRGGEGPNGYIVSKDARRKLKKAWAVRSANAEMLAEFVASIHTPEYDKKRAEGVRRYYSSSANRAAHKAACGTATARKNYRAARAKWFEVPENLERFRAVRNDASVRANNSRASKLRYAAADKETRAAWAKSIREGHRTAKAKLNCAVGAKARYAKMTPDQRKAYWHSTHPNGNGHGRDVKT